MGCFVEAVEVVAVVYRVVRWRRRLEMGIEGCSVVAPGSLRRGSWRRL
jgi:hypothetical protein